jgi:hypothetical protein
MRKTFLLALLALAACTPDHPFDKPGTWSLDSAPSSNDANLRVMVANPHDLVAGTGEANSLGAEAGPPVGGVLLGRRAPLPASGVAQIQAQGDSAAPPPPPNGNQQ